MIFKLFFKIFSLFIHIYDSNMPYLSYWHNCLRLITSRWDILIWIWLKMTIQYSYCCIISMTTIRCFFSQKLPRKTISHKKPEPWKPGLGKRKNRISNNFNILTYHICRSVCPLPILVTIISTTILQLTYLFLTNKSRRLY